MSRQQEMGQRRDCQEKIAKDTTQQWRNTAKEDKRQAKMAQTEGERRQQIGETNSKRP